MLESHREILQSPFTIAAEPRPRYASGPVSYVPTGHSTDFGYAERGSDVRGPLVTNTSYFYTHITQENNCTRREMKGSPIGRSFWYSSIWDVPSLVDGRNRQSRPPKQGQTARKTNIAAAELVAGSSDILIPYLCRPLPARTAR